MIKGTVDGVAAGVTTPAAAAIQGMTSVDSNGGCVWRSACRATSVTSNRATSGRRAPPQIITGKDRDASQANFFRKSPCAYGWLSGTYTIAPRHLRFAISLHARWCWRCCRLSFSANAMGVLTAGPAFAAGGEPIPGDSFMECCCAGRYRLYCRAGDHYPHDPRRC